MWASSGLAGNDWQHGRSLLLQQQHSYGSGSHAFAVRTRWFCPWPFPMSLL